VILIGIYLEQYKKAWRSLRQHKILFLPDLLSFLAILLLGWLAVSLSGLFPLISQVPSLQTEEQASKVITAFIGQNFGELIVSIIGFCIAAFVVGSGMLAAKFGLIRQILSKKQPTSDIAWTWGRAFFWKVVRMRLGVFLLYLGSVVVCGILFALLQFVHQVFAAVITMLAIIILTALLLLGLFMRYPALYKKNMSVSEAIKTSYSFFIKNKQCVVMTAFIIAVTTLVVKQIFEVIMTISLSVSGKGAAIVAVIMSVLMLLVMMGARIFGDLYTFQIYEHYKAKK
jgi:hypothetical protein